MKVASIKIPLYFDNLWEAFLTMTYPDISNVVQVVSQFFSVPQKHHLTAVYHILRYPVFF